MKVSIKTQPNRQPEVIQVEFCCKDMETAWNESYVQMGDRSGFYNDSTDINIYTAYDGDCEENEINWRAKQIKYCPFCAQSIEATITPVDTTTILQQKIKELERSNERLQRDIGAYQDRIKFNQNDIDKLKVELAGVVSNP